MTACIASEPQDATRASRSGDASGPVSSDAWSAFPKGWTDLPQPPEDRGGEAWIWVGDRLVVAGGCHPELQDRCRGSRRSYSFDPRSGRWSRAAPAARPLAGATAVWTGSEALFLETTGHADRIPMQAYDPTTDRWRALAPAPLAQAYGVAVVWTGERLIVWGGGDRGSDRTRRGTTYDPATDVWSPIAEAPIGLNASDVVWTGSEMILVGSVLSRANRAPMETAVGEAYDPAADVWRVLPPSALSPQASSVVWIGDRVLAWDYETRSQTYDPVTDRWSAPIDMPLEFSECYPTSTVIGDVVLAWFCGTAALYGRDAAGWERLDGGPLDETVYSEAYRRDIHVWRFAKLVPAGAVVVMPMEGLTLNRRGVACYGCDGSPRAYRVYRPPDAVVPDEVSLAGKEDAELLVSAFLYAWQDHAEGLLPWLVTPRALDRFESHVPDTWTRSTFRFDGVAPAGPGEFTLALDLIIRDERVTVVPLSLRLGPATPIGGEPVPLAIVDVERR